MFSCSIAENIAYGADNPSEVTAEQVEKVAEVANAAAFIRNFPQGFGTVVGEKGVLLSGTCCSHFAATPLCPSHVSGRSGGSICYFPVRVLSFEVMKSDFPLSESRLHTWAAPPLPSVSTPEVPPNSHRMSHRMSHRAVLGHRSFCSRLRRDAGWRGRLFRAAETESASSLLPSFLCTA